MAERGAERGGAFAWLKARLGGGGAVAGDGRVGVEIARDGVALAHVVGPEEAPRLAACEFRPCEDAEEAGAALAEAVRELGLAGTACTAVLPSHRYALRLLDAPEVEPDEMAAAAQWLVKDLLDFPLEEAAVDHIQVPERPGGRSRIYVVTARGEVVEEIAAEAGAAGLALDVVDVSELALRNLAARLPEDEQGVALLRLGRRGGTLTMSQAGCLYLARGVETGFETLRETAVFEGEGLERPEENEAFELLVLELQRSLDYYESQLGPGPIGHLVVAPCEEEVPGLVPYLEKHLSVGVGPLELDAFFVDGPRVEPALQARCLLALGAALRREGASS